MRIDYGLTDRFLPSHAGLVCLYGLLQQAADRAGVDDGSPLLA